MSKIENQFKTNQKTLIPYLTAGDPDLKTTVLLMHALVRAGAGLIELGVPFSDPMADGPVIEAAHHRAVSQHVTVEQVLATVAEFRQQDKNTPVVLMSYLNPLEKLGYAHFAQKAQTSGVDGVLVVDLPPEEGKNWIAQLTEHHIDPIFLIAPTTPLDRIQKICQQARGFLYYVSLKGVTGSQALDIKSVNTKIAKIREVTDLPIAVGFGVRDVESVKELAKIADAIVMGSTVVAKIHDLHAKSADLATELEHWFAKFGEGLDNGFN